jgi:hypothetical protein
VFDDGEKYEGDLIDVEVQIAIKDDLSEKSCQH